MNLCCVRLVVLICLSRAFQPIHCFPYLAGSKGKHTCKSELVSPVGIRTGSNCRISRLKAIHIAAEHGPDTNGYMCKKKHVGVRLSSNRSVARSSSSSAGTKPSWACAHSISNLHRRTEYRGAFTCSFASDKVFSRSALLPVTNPIVPQVKMSRPASSSQKNADLPQ